MQNVKVINGLVFVKAATLINLFADAGVSKQDRIDDVKIKSTQFVHSGLAVRHFDHAFREQILSLNSTVGNITCRYEIRRTMPVGVNLLDMELVVLLDVILDLNTGVLNSTLSHYVKPDVTQPQTLIPYELANSEMKLVVQHLVEAEVWLNIQIDVNRSDV